MNENQNYEETDYNTKLLSEMVAQQKKTNSRMLVIMIAVIVIVVVFAVSALVVVPKAVTLINTTTEIASEAEESMSAVNDLVTSNTNDIAGILEKVNNVDFDSLNQSIKDLSDILTPLANAMGVFK